MILLKGNTIVVIYIDELLVYKMLWCSWSLRRGEEKGEKRGERGGSRRVEYLMVQDPLHTHYPAHIPSVQLYVQALCILI